MHVFGIHHESSAMTSKPTAGAPFQPEQALVIGASRGIGAAILRELEALGYRATGISKSDVDISKKSEVDQFFENWSGPLPRLLVCNAGINNPQTITSDDFHKNLDETLQTNFSSHAYIIQKLLPSMATENFGRIVAISSLFASQSKQGRAAYSSSKAALEAFVRSVALEHAGQNVLANIIRPGFVDTDLTRRNNSLEEIKRLEGKIPIGRLATTDEVARLASFLLSAENTYITGQSISIDGGFSLT
jgi:3-oxoacyl-[acyl-carrier protein] reductase